MENLIKTAYIAYTNKSSSSGRSLFKFLSTNNIGGYSWRRSFKKIPKNKCSIMLRWGNSRKFDNIGLELNKASKINNSIDKKSMILKFIENKILIPNVNFITKNKYNTKLDSLKFIRDKNNIVRLDSNILEGDIYCTDFIDKKIELRVHIFNSKCIGVYEKIPADDNPILKNSNCTFKRIDMSKEDNLKRLKGARGIAKRAVNSLGMLFGGVDVIMSKDGLWYILEVNSAPSLNTYNIERYSKEIEKYLLNNLQNGC